MSGLGKRIGYDRAARLMNMRRGEERAVVLGVRDPDQPSQALFEIENALMASEFTAEERRRLRFLSDINPVEDLGLGEDRT